MNLLSRLFGKRPDEREALRPLWQRVVELARARAWYARLGVADTMEGRFDMVSLVLAAVLLRMEREPELAESQARLTELFVDDMDGQLRQNGIGDPTVGKHVRKLVTTLGGRLGALREALPRWLNESALRPGILAIAPAQPKHGGRGAFYVLLKRRREQAGGRTGDDK